MNIGGGKDFGDFNADDIDFGDLDLGDMTPPDRNAAPAEQKTAAGERPADDFGFGGGKGGFSMSGGGADLNYTDDELDSYETIWDGEITDTTKADHKRVVTALKNISEGNALEDYMDVDNAFSGTTFFDTLMENETYHSQYYAYLQQLVSEYINGGGFDAFYAQPDRCARGVGPHRVLFL